MGGCERLRRKGAEAFLIANVEIGATLTQGAISFNRPFSHKSFAIVCRISARLSFSPTHLFNLSPPYLIQETSYITFP
jgi:hypothetical protein